jgi:hypothetical protein
MGKNQDPGSGINIRIRNTASNCVILGTARSSSIVFFQCFISRSGLDSDPDPGRLKLAPKKGKNDEITRLKSLTSFARRFKKTYTKLFDQKVSNYKFFTNFGIIL